MQNPSQETPASSKAPNQDLKDIDVLCTFKIKIESQNLELPYPNKGQDVKPQPGASSVLKIILERQKWNKGVLKTSYPDFGTR